VIETRGLNFAYGPESEPAVRELSFEVRPGEVFGFLGPSGSGKSTTQKILIGLLTGYEGEVRVLGKDRVQWTPDDYERIGVSFETPNHFNKLSGLENLRYFGALYRRPTREPHSVLASLGLEGDGDTPVGEWSKGMRSRLSVARCLLHDPDLLFLDEPTAGLDPVNAQRVKELIEAERGAGRTVFLTTHDMTVADELCDRVAFLVDGRIVSIDAPRALKLQHGERSVRVEFRTGDSAGHRDFPLDGIGSDEGFRSLLMDAEVQTIHSREASLADVFIAVTGRTLS
jgi:fluoroquinolone transport system ATP-binding protein